MSPRILLLGKNGQVGWELERSLQPLGEVTPLGRDGADLARPETLAAVIDRMAPQVIVNAAAYTAVDKAEEEEELAQLINGQAVAELARLAGRHKALLVHYSTDYVFDGKQETPYSEEATTCPVNAYGRSKRAGEQAITESGCAHLILRTSWVYSHRGHNFVATMRRLMAERDELKIVSDQIGAPTSARLIADTTAVILARLNLSRPTAIPTSQQGLFHLTAQGHTSWHAFAQAILELAPELRDRSPRLVPIPTSDYPTPAQRPANSCLNCSRIQQTFDLTLPTWQDSLRLSVTST